MDEQETVEYILRKGPITYHFENEAREATFITLRPPTGKHIVEVSQLKQLVFRALTEQNSEDESAPEDKVTELRDIKPESVMLPLMMSEKVEFSKILLTGRELFTGPISRKHPVAFVEGETPLRLAHVDNMHPEDFQLLVCKYLVNFILASTFSGTESDS